MKWLAFAFVAFILAVIVGADMGILPEAIHRLYDFPNGDKVGHFVLYGILTLLLDLALFRARPAPLSGTYRSGMFSDLDRCAPDERTPADLQIAESLPPSQ